MLKLIDFYFYNYFQIENYIVVSTVQWNRFIKTFAKTQSLSIIPAPKLVKKHFRKLYMRADIHPNYQDATITCGCGNKVKTKSVLKEITVSTCSACHPFFTGKHKFVDTAGRIEKFNKKLAKADAK